MPTSLPTTTSSAQPPTMLKKDETTPVWLWFLLAVVLFQLGFMVLVEVQGGHNNHNYGNSQTSGLDFLVLSECQENESVLQDIAMQHSPSFVRALQTKCAEKKQQQPGSQMISPDSHVHHEHPRLAAPHESHTHNTLPRIMAIFFPQYHKDPLNDQNWGANFTDWVSLKNAPATNYLGYPIPRPTELLGYYDLNNRETRQLQGQLAHEHGIDGFIYHHYWFYDKAHPGPNLAQPLLNMLEDGHPNLPFFLNWCAVKWVNVWMGRAIFQKIPTNRNRAIILQEQYLDVTDEQIKAHYDWLAPFFHHANYIKIHNQPVFLTYFYNPEANPILQKLRQYAREDGFDGIHLIAGRSAMPDHLYTPPKNMTQKTQENLMRTMQTLETIEMDEAHKNTTIFNQSMFYPYPLEYVQHAYKVPDWCLKEAHNPPFDEHHHHPEVVGVITTFDNSPRRPEKEASIYNPGPPEQIIDRFRKNLVASLYYQMCCHLQSPETTSHDAHGHNSNDENNDRFIAINAWNEWGEGMALEPSDVYGTHLLQVIRETKAHVAQMDCRGDQVPPESRGDPSDPVRTADEIRAELIRETGWIHPNDRKKKKEGRR